MSLLPNDALPLPTTPGRVSGVPAYCLRSLCCAPPWLMSVHAPVSKCCGSLTPPAVSGMSMLTLDSLPRRVVAALGQIPLGFEVLLCHSLHRGPYPDQLTAGAAAGERSPA